MAINPIIYGNKKPLRFFDILIDGITADTNDQIHGWRKKTYEEILIASLTKKMEWDFQKEWRVSFSPDAGANKQPFPFIKSIYLGEKMKPHNRKILINLAKRNGWDIFERKLNKSESEIIYQRVER